MTFAKTKDMLSKEKIEEYKKAHKDGNKEMLHGRVGKYIGDFVYGANDGIITTFAVVSAVTGAALQPFIVMIIGIANLLADGFSMAAGDYLATKSEQEYRQKQRKIEEWEVKHLPEEETKEIEGIYARKGFKGKLLEKVVEVITGDKKVWVDTMMMEEHHMAPFEKENPLKKGAVTFFAFVIAGSMPLIPYAFSIQPLFKTSIFITALTLFIVGATRTFITGKNWFKSGVEMLIVGTLAASVAYAVGWFLGSLGYSI